MILALLFACAIDGASDTALAEALTSDGSFCGDGRDGDVYFHDGDGDGHGDPDGDTVTVCRSLQGYADVADDCDDADVSVHPGASETCDGVDNDCDGTVDPTDSRGAATWFADADADGFGDPNQIFVSCEAIAAYVADNTDCDDGDASVSPLGVETCNGLDDDCNGTVDDEPSDGRKYYVDVDGDFQGDRNAEAARFCEMPAEGYSFVNYDCDDADASIRSGADELCDGIDNDCDDEIDDDPVDGIEYFVDADGDGFGGTRVEHACEPTVGLTEDSADCDDRNASVSPVAAETCNNADDDCDCAGDSNGDGWVCGFGDDGVDEDAVDALTWYNDADTDGYGDPTTGVTTCVPYLYFPWSYTPDGTDCDDGDVRVHPFSDSDVDGFLGCDDDCDDGNPDINPSVVEEGCSTVDLDCNGTAGIDEPTADCQVAVAVVNDGVGFTVTITVPAGFDAWANAGFEPTTITLEPEDASYAARSADYAGDDAATVIALGRTGFTPYATDANGSTAWADMSAWYVDEAASDVRVVIYPDNTGTAANFLFAY